MQGKKFVCGLAMLACCLTIAWTAAAQTVEQFYKRRTVTLTVGSAPGGLNDIAARLVARYLGEAIPGEPTIVVQNRPGAGGLIAANNLYNLSKRDGSEIGLIQRGTAQLAFEGDPNVHFEALNFTWLGSLSSYAFDAYLLVVNADHPAKTVADLKQPGVSAVLGSTVSGETNQEFALLAKEVLGLNVEVVRGYAGAAPMFLAMQSGEIDGQLVGYSAILAGQRGLWTEKRLRPLVQFGRLTRLPALADVPTGRELATDAEPKSIIEFAELPFFMALPLAAPPDLPPDRAQALRAAFDAMCKNQGFVEQAQKLGLDISPIDGNAVIELLKRAAATPREVIARYASVVGPRS